MKKNIFNCMKNAAKARRLKNGLMAILLTFAVNVSLFSQCTTGVLYISNYTPTCNGTAQTISTCQYAGEYSTINLIAGTSYTFSSSIATDYITIATDPGNVAQAWGVTPVVFTPSASGLYRVYIHTDVACGTMNSCRNLMVQCGTPPPPVTNDDCATAIPVACGDIINGTTLTANPDPTATVCGGNVTSNGVWYSFTGSGQNLTLSLCGSSYDSYIHVYSGICAALTCVASNDDFCGLQSQVVVPTTAGTTYYILINGYGSNSGNFTLTLPPAVTANATNDGPYCIGSTIQLNSVGGSATDDWAGPLGYTATDTQNPTRPGALPTMSGVYTVTVSNAGGCVATATTTVDVVAAPLPTAANSGPYCEGDTVQLNSTGGATYSWAGPMSFSDTTQNPSIPMSTAAMSGTYTVTASLSGGCSATATTDVVVNANPIANATNTGPYCEGDTIQLNSVAGSATDDWVGPNAYSQTDMQNPTILSSTPIMNGLYTVTATSASGCSATSTTDVVVNAFPVANATNTGPYCEGDNIQLNSMGGSATDDWAGPNTYSQTDMQNPTIVSASMVMTGQYTVTVTTGPGCSTTATTDVIVNANPIANATNTGPYCEGDTIQLNSVDGSATDDWAGPNAYLQLNMQNPSIPNSTSTMSGPYAVMLTNGSGCTATATTNVLVNAAPVTPTISQSGDTLLANPAVGFTYQWYMNGNPIAGATSSSYPASQTNNYSVVITNADGCSSSSANFIYTSTASIQENQLDAGINIYPNPTVGYVNISFTEPITGQIEVIDLNGRIIRTMLIADLQTMVSFDLSSLNAGIYQIRITTPMYTSYKKLVIK